MRQALIERTEEEFIIIGTNNDGKVSNIELTEELSSAIQVIETAVDKTADPALLEAKQRAAEAERRLQESQAQIIETEQRIEQIQTQVDETVQKLENVQVQVTEKHAIITELTIEVDDTKLGTYKGTVSDLDLVQYLSKDDSGNITRGWHTIKVTPDNLSRVEFDLVIQLFANSRGGGQY